MVSALILLLCISNAALIKPSQAMGKAIQKLDDCKESPTVQILTEEEKQAFVKLLSRNRTAAIWKSNSQLETMAATSLVGSSTLHHRTENAVGANYIVSLGGVFTTLEIAEMAVGNWRRGILKRKRSGDFGCAYKYFLDSGSPADPNVRRLCTCKFTCFFSFPKASV